MSMCPRAHMFNVRVHMPRCLCVLVGNNQSFFQLLQSKNFSIDIETLRLYRLHSFGSFASRFMNLLNIIFNT